jgi:hypothetical protein
MNPSPWIEPLRLVLAPVVGAAMPGAPGLAASGLGARLGLPLLAIDAALDPEAALTRLQAESGPWLAPLTVDPGTWLGPAGRWGELLGAFRQPTVLLVEGTAVSGGTAAATTALLERAQVPLVGLIQWGGPWEPQIRRAEGLAWLGWLEASEANGPATPEPKEEDPGLRQALLLRWRGLDQGAGQSGMAPSRLS